MLYTPPLFSPVSRSRVRLGMGEKPLQAGAGARDVGQLPASQSKLKVNPSQTLQRDRRCIAMRWGWKQGHEVLRAKRESKER